MDVSEAFEIVWNWEEFHVPYISLQNEMKIGKYFIKELIRNEKETITQPQVFADAVFQRLIFERNTKQRLVYAQVLTWTFSKMSQDIGPFSEMSRLSTLTKQ